MKNSLLTYIRITSKHHTTKLFFTLFLSCFYLTSSFAQNRAYEVYFDTDNNQATGCTVTHENLEEIIGVDAKLTITTDNQVPSILSTHLYNCLNADFIESSNLVTSSLGFNNGNNGEDVFESKLLFSDIGIDSTNSIKVFYATTHDTAEDIVIEKSPGTPIIITNLDPIQIPGLGIIGLFLLALFIYTISKKKIKKISTLMVYLFLISPLVWAFTIIIDGQTSDWERIEVSASDPVGDTSNPGEFSDITSVYAVSQEETIYLRMDIVDVENQPPLASDTTAVTLEDNQVTVQLIGQDPNNDNLTFTIEQAPSNGLLGQITQINATTSEVVYTPSADFNGTDNFTFKSNDGISNSTIATAELTITAVNDAPSFTAGADITVAEDSGIYQQIWASNIVSGPTNESGQQLNLNIITNRNPSLFNVQPYLDSSGQLTFSTFNNVHGTTQLSINLKDDGGTANGGIDTSINYELNITVTPINDPPRIISTPTFTIDTCGADYSYDVNAIDADSGDIITYSLSASFTDMSIDNTTGLLIWNAANLQIGTHAITVKATDLALANDIQSYELVVAECNLAPIITSISTQSVNEFDTYNYDVDAIDQNISDVLDYSIIYSPNNSTINNVNGTVDSTLESSIKPQSVRILNEFCKTPILNNETTPFSPKVKWSWGRRKALSMPLVVPLFDDNNDGFINVSDNPVVLINSYSSFIDSAQGWLVALDGKTGEEIWEQQTSINGINVNTRASSTPAIGDIDGDGVPEIIAFTRSGNVVAFDNNGIPIWLSQEKLSYNAYNYGSISLYDIDGDGKSEILARNMVLNFDGSLRWSVGYGIIQNHRTGSYAVDINGDNNIEVIMGDSMYDNNGNLLAFISSNRGSVQTSVGNFDNDEFPEFIAVIATRSGHPRVQLLDSDWSLIWEVEATGIGRGGPPVISDLDGNGVPEISFIGSRGHIAFDAQGNELWRIDIKDLSTGTNGSVSFDFDGDGKHEIVSQDEEFLRVIDGVTGEVVFEQPMGSLTAAESPIVADVDGNGHADIVVNGNFVDGSTVVVFQDINDRWIDTRKIWNQYWYHIDNISDDLSIPSQPVKSWLTHNTFRLNTFPDRNPFGLVDLALFDLILNETDVETSISIQVTNRGLAPSESQSTVNIYNGNPDLDGTLLGSLNVPILASGEKSTLSLNNIPPNAITTNLYARIDEAKLIDECVENNNTTSSALFEVQATDPQGLYDTQRFSVFIENINQVPTINTTTLENATTRLIYNQQITATDPDIGDGLSYELINPPTGLSINRISGNLLWIPNQGQIGTYTITVKVTDLEGLSDTKDLILEVVANEQNRWPHIISAPIITAKVDGLYNYKVQGYDPDGDVIGFRLLQGPTGMTMDVTKDTIQWTPNLSDVGEHDIILEVHDALGATGQQTYLLHVFQYDVNNPQNQAPVITSTPVFDAEQNNPYYYQIQANDPDGDTLIYAKVAGPAEMSVDTNTGLLSWIPITYGEKTVSISVSDGQYTIVQQWTLNIILQGTIPTNTAPFISSAPIYDAIANNQYNYQVVAIDFDGDPINYQLNQSPTGMTVSSTGLIQWLPDTTQIGQSSIILQVSDDRGAQVIQSYEITVNTQNSVNHSPQITSTPTNTHLFGSLYSYTIQATDIDGDSLSYNLVSAPTGMTLDANTNTIQWNPASAGSYIIALSVADQQYIVTQQWILTITDGTNTINLAPSILSAPNQNAQANTAYNYTVIANDPEADPLIYQLLQAPTGMSISTTGQITWQVSAPQIGAQTVTIRVFDDHTNYSEQSFDINVTDPNNGNNQNHAPTINSLPTYIIQKGDIYSYHIQATDSDTDVLTYSKTAGPNDMVLNTITNALSWQTNQVGDYNIGITVSDQQYTVTQNWIVRVIESELTLNSNLHVTPQAALVNQSVEIFVQPQGGIGNITITATLDNQPLTLDASNHATKSFATEGLYIVQAHITDDLETITLEKTIIVSDTLDLFAPEIDIHTPTDGSSNTGFIDFNISVNDPNISQWQLGYRTAEAGENSPRTLIASGTNNVDHQNVVSFDTSQLRNGIYVFVLEAIDTFGQSISIDNSFFIEGDLKIGNFQIAFEDLTIPVAGMPVTITRSYDTRNRNADEAFGKGWEIGYQSLQLSESKIPGLGWYQTTEYYNIGPVRLPRFCIESIGDRLVSVRMPDGTLEKFKVMAKTLNPTSDERSNCQDIIPSESFNVQFRPQGDTNSTLTSNDIAGNVKVINGNLQTLIGTQPIDPNKYTLTLLDGTKYSIDQGFNLTDIETTDGNSIKFTHNGIEHNNGYSVQFIRDSQDRIRFIQKPNGERIEYTYNANGDLTSHTDLMGNTTTFTYILDHYLEEINDPRGIMVARNEYDADGRLIAHIDAQGNRIEYTHDIAGRTETIKDRNGNSSVYVYDNAGSVIAETNALGETTFHEYNAIRLETKRTDPLGNETTWTYDNFGNQLTETDALGHITTSTYNNRGEILTQTDDDGNAVITNEYGDQNNPFDGGGNLKKVTDALGNNTNFHWTVGQDSNLNTVVVNTGFTDAKGNRYEVSPLTSGTNNGITGTTTDLNGLKTQSTYDDEARPLTQSQIITDTNGVEIARYTTTFEYNENGDIIKTTDDLGNITRTEYNSLNKVSATVDAAGNRTTYEFDDRGNPSKTTYPDGSFETTTYDAEGNAIASTDRAGRITKTIYDTANRVTQVILPDETPADDSDNPRTTNSYDAAGRLVAVTDALGNSTSYIYDAQGRRTTTTDALGNTTSFVYDNLGRRTQSTDALGRVTNFEYNALGNLTKTTFANGTFTSTTYDELSRKVSETDLAGKTTSYEYSNAGNLTAVIDSLNQRTEYTYDQRGNKITQKDANNNITTWTYDELGRVSSRTLPAGQVETFTYDSRGNLATKTDFNGDTTTYAYNNLNQLVTTTYADATTVVNTYTITGQINSMTDYRGATTYQYDSQNRLTRLEYPDGNFIEYQYDLNGNRTLLTTANQVVSYSYDALNRSSTVTDSNGITTYTYDAVGNRATQVNANGTTATYSYDLLNRLTNLVHTDSTNSIIASYAYTLGANGNRTRIEEATGRIVDYTYDDLYRLLTETITDPINGNHFSQWSYDDVGNRLQQEKDGVVTTYIYNNNDQLQSETENAVVTSYTYDANGNTLSKSVDNIVDTSYSYNKDNRMVQAVTPTSTIINTYDAGGIRQSQTVNGITTNYLVDQNRAYAQVLEEQNDLFIPQVTYVYGDDLISQTQSGATHTFGYDGLGSTRILTDASGTVQNAYGYEAFGEVDYQLGTIQNKYLFTGEQYDNNVGFYYLRARFYNPQNGRFVNMDTFAGMQFEPKTLHKYLYTHADPVNFIDPSGNISILGLSRTQQVAGLIALYATVNYGPTLIKFFSSSLLALGSAMVEGAVNSYDWLLEKGQEDARTKLEDVVIAATIARGYDQNKLLFHYTTAIGRLSILGCSCINASKSFNHPDGFFRPSGAYATIIPPWFNMTQFDLRYLLYAKPMSHVVTNYVAFVATGADPWVQLPNAPSEWVSRAPRGVPIPIKLVFSGRNIMRTK